MNFRLRIGWIRRHKWNQSIPNCRKMDLKWNTISADQFHKSPHHNKFCTHCIFMIFSRSLVSAFIVLRGAGWLFSKPPSAINKAIGDDFEDNMRTNFLIDILSILNIKVSTGNADQIFKALSLCSYLSSC